MICYALRDSEIEILLQYIQKEKPLLSPQPTTIKSVSPQETPQPIRKTV
jgi:hypothetical protein